MEERLWLGSTNIFTVVKIGMIQKIHFTAIFKKIVTKIIRNVSEILFSVYIYFYVPKY
jgi:hypothetical protein